MKRILFVLGLFPLLLSCGPQVRDGDSAARTMLNRADEAFLAGDYLKAETLFQQYVHTYPQTPDAPRAYHYSGKCHLAMGKVREGLSDLQMALELARDPLLRLRIHETMARGYKQNGEPARAAASLDEILSAPRTLSEQVIPRPELLLQVGLSWLRASDWERGRGALETLVREFPSGEESQRAREKLTFTERKFFIQLGSFRDQANAEQHVRELHKKDVSARIRQADLSDGRMIVWVLSGGYDTWEEAAREADQLKKRGIDALVVP